MWASVRANPIGSVSCISRCPAGEGFKKVPALPGRLRVAQHAVLGTINETSPVPQGRLKLFFHPMHGKEFLQFVREAEPLVMFDLPQDILTVVAFAGFRIPGCRSAVANTT
jgi:hypothetical protein